MKHFDMAHFLNHFYGTPVDADESDSDESDCECGGFDGQHFMSCLALVADADMDEADL